MAQIKPIQGLRASAALSVVFGHFEHEITTMSAAEQHGFHSFLLNFSGAGVDLFFVISGFVMISASRHLFEAKSGALEFITRRLSRIVPLYWIMTSLFLAVLIAMPGQLHSPHPQLSEIAASYFFVPFAHAKNIPVQPVYKLGWTLNYEMFFYFIFSAVLFLPMKKAVTWLGILFLGLVALGATMPHLPTVLAYWTNPIILEFVLGAALGALWLEGFRLTSTITSLLALGGLLGFAAGIYFNVDSHGFARPLLLGVPAAMLLAAAALRATPVAEVRKDGLFVVAMVALGDASFSIYLLHPLVVRVLRKIWDRLPANLHISPWLFLVLGMVIVIGLSLAVYRWFEKPFTKLVQKHLHFWLRDASRQPATV